MVINMYEKKLIASIDFSDHQTQAPGQILVIPITETLDSVSIEWGNLKNENGSVTPVEIFINKSRVDAGLVCSDERLGGFGWLKINKTGFIKGARYTYGEEGFINKTGKKGFGRPQNISIRQPADSSVVTYGTMRIWAKVGTTENYAILENGFPKYAPPIIKVDGQSFFDPPPTLLRAIGYKPVCVTDPPIVLSGHEAIMGWVDEGERIVQTWTEKDMSQLPDVEDISEAFAMLGVKCNKLTRKNLVDIVTAVVGKTHFALETVIAACTPEQRKALLKDELVSELLKRYNVKVKE